MKVPDQNAEGVWIAHGSRGSTIYDFENNRIRTPLDDSPKEYTDEEWESMIQQWIGFVTGNSRWEKLE